MPASPTNNLDAALKNPTSAPQEPHLYIAAVGARVTSAFAMIESATKENQGAEIVAAWYHADPATCTKAADFCPTESDGGAGAACVHSDVCAHTPAAHADVMAAMFETNLHYGHSVARIKVMQALAILANDLATGATTANMADLKKDVLAHMLVPMYQGAIEAANRMDNSATAAKGHAAFAAYWNVIKDKVTFHAHDKGRLDALAAMEVASGANNLCTVRTLLHRNLPDGSKLQYHHDWIPCPDGERFSPCPGAKDTAHAKEVTGVHNLTAGAAWDSESETKNATLATEAVHLQERDIGTLKEVVDSEGKYPACVMPPPSPPPSPAAPPPPPPSPASPVKSSDSGLSDGEVAGVAIGAAVGGIVLLVIVGLILRSLMIKDAKPVFTCLEKAPTKSPPA